MNSLHLLQQSLATLSKIRSAENDPQEATAIRMAEKSKYISEQRQEWAPTGNEFFNAYRMVHDKVYPLSVSIAHSILKELDCLACSLHLSLSPLSPFLYL